jgi:hypothetical protein
MGLLVTDYDARRAQLSVTKARVLRRDKNRTKTQEDRDVELCPRALEVLRRHLARHSSVTWQLMLGKNLLWVAKQHAHCVEVMLRMHAAWLEGATESDIHAIKLAMERRPVARAAFLDSRTAISSINAATNHVKQIVIRPPKSPEFGSRLAVGKFGTSLSTGNDLKKKWRRGWDSNPRAGITRPSDFESAPL